MYVTYLALGWLSLASIC